VVEAIGRQQYRRQQGKQGEKKKKGKKKIYGKTRWEVHFFENAEWYGGSQTRWRSKMLRGVIRRALSRREDDED